MLGLPDPRDAMAIGAATMAAIFLVAAGVQTVRLSGMRATLAEERAARAQETADRERVAREVEQRIATLQAAHARQQQELSDAYQADRAALDASAAAARADADELRRQVQTYAAAGAFGAGVDPATCRHIADRAATLGGLFTEVVGEGGAMAREADRWASATRALKRQIAADRAACRTVGR